MEEIPVAPSGLTHLQIHEYKHKLLLIKLNLASTIRPRWYLIKVDLDITLSLLPTTSTNGTYYYVFLTKHPNNIHKSDKFWRWWLEWNNYSLCKDINIIIYGQRVLIRPKQTPYIPIYSMGRQTVTNQLSVFQAVPPYSPWTFQILEHQQIQSNVA